MRPIKLRDYLCSIEATWVRRALTATDGDVRAASKLLGMPERTLWHRIRGPLAIDPGNYRSAKETKRG